MEKWEIVYNTHDELDCEFAKGLLSTNGFPVVMERRGAKTLAGIFGHAAALGELVLKVPPDVAEQAKALLAARAEMEDEEDA